MRGIHINLPFGLGGLWVEWREQSVGFGHERNASGSDWEFFLWRLQGVYSRVRPPR